MKIFDLLPISLFLMLSLLGINQASAEQKLRYTYDSLGRLTFVEDSVNGNRDFDYDSAGNRTHVIIGSPGDDVPPNPPPPAPTLPLHACSQQYLNVYKAIWNSVPGASYYIIRSTSSVSPEHKVTTTSFYIDQGGAKCSWVKACNVYDVCSEKTYF
mgnify:CR=1 FL=1